MACCSIELCRCTSCACRHLPDSLSLPLSHSSARIFIGTNHQLFPPLCTYPVLLPLSTRAQLAAVGVMCALAWVFGQWPPTSLSPSSSSSSRSWGKVSGGTSTSVAADGATSTSKSGGVHGSGPKSAKAGSGGSTSGAAAGGGGEGGAGVPADAVSISQEEAVSLVDGGN